MAYVDKKNGKPTGSFVGEWSKGKKKRRFKTMQEAKDYERFTSMFGREPPTIDEGGPAAGELTFSQVCEKAKAAGGPKGKWKKTDDDLMQRLDYCCEVIGDLGISRVTRGVLKQITEALATRKTPEGKRGPDKARGHMSNARMNRYLSAASGVLTWAVNEEIIAAKPSVPWLNETDDRRHRDILAIGQDEVVLGLIESHGNRIEAMCLDCIAQTGLRQGELQKLTPEQITIEQVEDDTGTPVLVGVLHLKRGQTKNKKSRPVIFSAELAKNIRALIATGSLPTADRLLTIFQSACKEAGIEGNLVVHSLRHARNTRLRKAGVSKKIRKEMLGHISDEANEIYDHVDLEDQLEAVKKLDEYAGKRLKRAKDGQG
jgi:integrase